MQRSTHSQRHLSTKHTPTSEILQRKVSEECHVTRLFVVMVILYVALTGPLTFIILMNGMTPYWTWPQQHVYTGLRPIFELIFYFYFAIVFFLLCSYSDRFRRTLIKTCCCGRRRRRYCCCCRRGAEKPEHKPVKQRKAR